MYIHVSFSLRDKEAFYFSAFEAENWIRLDTLEREKIEKIDAEKGFNRLIKLL